MVKRFTTQRGTHPILLPAKTVASADRKAMMFLGARAARKLHVRNVTMLWRPHCAGRELAGRLKRWLQRPIDSRARLWG